MDYTLVFSSVSVASSLIMSTKGSAEASSTIHIVRKERIQESFATLSVGIFNDSTSDSAVTHPERTSTSTSQNIAMFNCTLNWSQLSWTCRLDSCRLIIPYLIPIHFSVPDLSTSTAVTANKATMQKNEHRVFYAWTKTGCQAAVAFISL